MASSNKTRPGWFQDGQPTGFERYWNGWNWEGTPRPIQQKELPHRRAWTIAGAVFIALFVMFNLSAGEAAAIGIILVSLSPFILVAIVLWLLWRAGSRKTVVMQATTPTQPTGPMPPGWYPDMGDPTLQRWFDGHSWTSATLPRQP
ncbi:DUF2510 domain-containing protein [Rhodococcoides yunnanense]|uniref:DUF2510 domain-containing protein n=1 Tax=Rhodococcoides yunnanense TaxID=278209 RepID=UPI001FEBC3C6|nr:DUF2510 domain-containing protein [Rhodococcus yunnanensis]